MLYFEGIVQQTLSVSSLSSVIVAGRSNKKGQHAVKNKYHDNELYLQNITKTFVKDGVKFDAVEHVDLRVQGGELVTFLGPSGCGKTTTLRMVAGFETPTSGKIFIDGQDVTNVMVNKREIGFVFQNYALFPHMTIGDNVAYGLKMRSEAPSDITRKVGEALELVGLNGTEKRLPNQLSGGEQQRVAIARALAKDPDVFLCDEPTGALDSKSSKDVLRVLHNFCREFSKTVIIITHNNAIASMADRIMVLRDGRIIDVIVNENPADIEDTEI